MSTPTFLSIGGVELDFACWCLSASVTHSTDGTVKITASGWQRPALDGIDWSGTVALIWTSAADSADQQTASLDNGALEIAYDLSAGSYTWTLAEKSASGSSAIDPSGSLSIGGVQLDLACWNLSASVTRSTDGTVKVAASGRQRPALDGIDWSETVAVIWNPTGDAGDVQTAALDNGALEIAYDLVAGSYTWTLAEKSASGSSASESDLWAAVTIGGTGYDARVSREPLGGTIQRKTNGAGTLLSAWNKTKVTITGEGPVPPVTAGSVAIASAVYTGSLLITGISSANQANSTALSWTLTGEAP